MIHFNDLEDEVRRIVGANPGFVYERPEGSQYCKYLRRVGGIVEGGCVFGRAFLNLGIPVREIEACEMKVLDTALRILNIPSTPTQRSWAYALQVSQDRGKTWSEALDAADRFCPQPARTR